jgi:gliding motility-associated-like protein
VKLVIKHFFILLILSGNLHSQTISYTLFIKNATCNGANDGRVDISITETNPPYTFNWNSGSEQSSVSGLAPGNYSVTIADASGNDTLVPITILEVPCLLAAENIFTPNNDSYNDSWTIENIEYYPDNLIMVFNRWGQKVFESKGLYLEWDGKDLLNIQVPDNSYYYIIYADKNDKASIQKGTVSILR